MKLFSGTANLPLAQKVAEELGVELSKAEVVRFDNSEVRVRIEEDVVGETTVVIQPTANPTDTNLIELFLFCDALRREEARRVIGVIPYFGYARQDIQHRSGEAVSANLVIRFLESIGFTIIYTYDIHDEATSGVFSIPFHNSSTFAMLAAQVKKHLKGVSKEDVAIVSPDQGGVERARRFGEHFFGTKNFKLVVIEKDRNINKLHTSRALDIYGDVKGKTAVLVDDIVTSAGTLINAAELCSKQGAQKVVAAIVHHDFSTKAPGRLQESAIDKFFTTDTILLKQEQKFAKLEEISIAQLIADDIRRFVK